MRGSPASLRNQATMAPTRTSSPCAKLVSPMVPNINERPSAARPGSAELQATGDQLPDLAGLSCSGAALGWHGGGAALATGVASGLADAEQHGLVLEGLTVVVIVSTTTPGRSGGNVSASSTTSHARPRDRYLPSALGVGLGRAHLAVVAGDGDGHALDGYTLVPEESADRLRTLLVLRRHRPRPDDDDGKGREEPRNSHCQPAHLRCTSGQADRATIRTARAERRPLSGAGA